MKKYFGLFKDFRVKSCPTCNRTFDDETLNFCLEDGSILFSLIDEDETRLAFRPLENNSIVTKVSNYNPKLTNPTQVMPTNQQLKIQTEYIQGQTKSKTNSRLWWAGSGILVCLMALGFIAMIIVSHIVKTSNSNVLANNSIKTPLNSNITSPTIKKKEISFSAWNYNASMNGENLTYYPVTTPEKCQADCAKNEKCKGFTFIRAGAYNPNDSAMCYLISYFKEMVTHACCISAVKN